MCRVMFVVKGRRQGAKATGGGGTKLGETPTGLQMGEPIEGGMDEGEAPWSDLPGGGSR